MVHGGWPPGGGGTDLGRTASSKVTESLTKGGANAMDVGQGTANGLYQQAVAGPFRMERGAAERCAAVYTRLVETCLDQQVAATRRLMDLQGFGGFDSSKELQRGFFDKWLATMEAVSGVREAALRMAAAFLQAGGAFEEADAMNRRALESVEVEQ